MNQVRGHSLREEEQEAQREDMSTGGDGIELELRCPDQVQTNPDPFGETPSPTTKPFSEPAGGP